MHKPTLILALILLSCNSTTLKAPAQVTEQETTDTNTDQDDTFQNDTDEEQPHDSSEPEDSGSPPEEAVNLLVDPSFEDGSSSWVIWGGAQLTTSNIQDGLYALQTTSLNGAEQLVAVEPNTTYRLSGWARTDDPSESISIGVKDHGNPEDRVFFSESSYTQKDLEFTTGFGTTTAVVYAYKHSGSSSGYADNLSLIAIEDGYSAPIWSDEFDDAGTPDPSKWVFESGFVRNQELQWYQSENAFQENGRLIIEGREEYKPNPNYSPDATHWGASREYIEYTSSSLKTKDLFDWKYGRVVVRAKVTNLTGTWPAIWTLGVDCEWPSNGEVDIMENYGGNILANFAWGTNQQWSAEWDSSATPVSSFDSDWASSFHIWELDWTSDKMSIYLDGVLLNSTSLNNTINGTSNCAGQNPFQQNHYLLLNLALGSNGGSVDSLTFPTQYIVDYVRVYQ